MAEFTPINSQEELDTIIKERLTRDREAQNKKYADYDEVKARNTEYESKIKELNSRIADYDGQLKNIGTKDKEISSLKEKVKSYETASLKAKIAHEMGLPYGLSDRLTGEDENAIKKDAEVLKSLFSAGTSEPPSVSSEPKGKNSTTEVGFKTLLNNLKN